MSFLEAFNDAQLRKSPYICRRKDCQYHTGCVNGQKESCNYLFVTGVSKTSQGAADHTKPCPLYTQGRRLVHRVPVVNSRPRPPESANIKYDRAQMDALHREGRTDDEICDAMGCHLSTVQKWRRDNGLAANRKPKKKPKKKPADDGGETPPPQAVPLP